MTDSAHDGDRRGHWIDRLSEFLPGFLQSHPILRRFHEKASAVLHGSVAMGIDDAFADLDLWLLVPEGDMTQLDAASETRFFELELDGKEGHLNAESVGAFSARVRGCDMDAIFQLRTAEVLADPTGAARELVGLARRPMRPEVSLAFFRYHYVEMRGEHRSWDNPIERSEPVGALLALSKTIAHALRAAIVLDRQPYPYDKWLHHAAGATPTGKLLLPGLERILDLLAADKLRAGGPESDHPIGVELRVMRQVLIDAAEAGGIRQPWLRKWWLHMDEACEGIRDIRW